MNKEVERFLESKPLRNGKTLYTARMIEIEAIIRGHNQDNPHKVSIICPQGKTERAETHKKMLENIFEQDGFKNFVNVEIVELPVERGL